VRFDLVLDNANIFTVDASRPRAGSVGIIADRIVAVSERHGLSSHEAERTVDLDGRFVVPGFNDAHNHMPAFGATLNEVPLNAGTVGSIEELVAAIGERVATVPAGTWVVGAGYDHNKLAEGRHPTCHELDRVSAEHPVLLNHTSGHFATLNTAAMRLARIGEVDVPAGGWSRSETMANRTGYSRSRPNNWCGSCSIPARSTRWSRTSTRRVISTCARA